MNAAEWRAALAMPVFLEVLAVGLLGFEAWTPLVLLCLAAMVLPVAELVVPSARGRFFIPAWVLVGSTGLGLILSNGSPGGTIADIGAGVLLGAPVTAAVVIVRLRKARLAFLLGLDAALALLVVLLATDEYVGTHGLAGTSANWLYAFSEVNSLQFAAILRWATGTTAGTTPPFAAVSDPVFVACAVLAILAMVLSLLERPAHAGGGPEPWDPHFPMSSGVVPLLVAALAGLAFEWVAAVAPREALLSVAVGVSAALVLIAVLVAYTRLRKDRPPDGTPRPADASLGTPTTSLRGAVR